MAKRYYGWVPDRHDARDLMAGPHWFGAGAPPQNLDLRPAMPAVYDQLTIGSCTAHGVATPAVIAEMAGTDPDPNFLPSRLFIYYMSRLIEGTVNEDSGAQIRDVIKAVVKYGMAPESMWPYDVDKFTQRPPAPVIAAARKETVKIYARVPQNQLAIKRALATGFPVVFGTILFQSFESDEVAETGVVPMPEQLQTPVGGHCMDQVGYDCVLDPHQQVIGGLAVRNSWGVEWGLQGYCVMPWEYLLDPNLSQDFWIIRALSR